MGDSLQWNTEGFFGRREVRVQVPNGPVLHFPDHVVEDAARFDAIVHAMIEYAEPPAAETAGFRAWLRRNGITDARDITTLERTYEDLAILRQTGRDHIWGYVLRNLSRPFALSAPARRADVVIGNPPWLSYRYMAPRMQERFREECKDRRLWTGGKVAAHQDMSAYFFARAVELYLKDGGMIAFVMPYAALTRQQFKGFQSQQFGRGRDQIVQFQEVWAFNEGVQPLFPVPSCAIFAERGATGARPETVVAFSGTLPKRDASSQLAEAALSREIIPWPEAGEQPARSPYQRLFRNGATVYPRKLFVVERVSPGRFGENPEAPLVRSRESRQQKQPWKDLEPLEGNVERRFLKRLYLGESLTPYRLLDPVEAIIPWERGSRSLLSADRARARGYLGLSRWMTESAALWEVHRRSTKTLLENLDYHSKLSVQFPPAQIRVIYAKSGAIPASAVLRDPEAFVENVLYWAPVGTLAEARYLIAILNSDTLRRRVENQQARGQWGARHFDKLLLSQPIPRFAKGNPDHQQLAGLAEQAERVAAAVALPDELYFVTARRRIRAALASDGVASAIDQLVEALLASGS